MGDVCRLGDEERAGDARALLVVLRREVHEDLPLCRAEPCEGCEDHSMAKCDVSDLYRAEECRDGGHG